MNDKVIPTYYSIMQLCDRWHFDLGQMRDFFSKKAIPLYACITGKEGGAFNQQVKVRETKINTATGEDLKRFGSLTNEELEKQGDNSRLSLLAPTRLRLLCLAPP